MSIHKYYEIPTLIGDYIGLEIELETVTLRECIGSSKYWTTCHDGSLRKYGIELKYSNPLKVNEVPLSLIELKDITKNWFKTYPTFSSRTGCHIHFNITHLSYKEIANIIVSFAQFVKVFNEIGRIKFNRLNNAYCIPIHQYSDWDYLLVLYKDGEYSKFVHQFIKKIPKYSSGYINVTLGTFEIRIFNSTLEPFRLLNWINICAEFLNNAKKINNSNNLNFSKRNIKEISKSYFGKYYDQVSPYINMRNIVRFNLDIPKECYLDSTLVGSNYNSIVKNAFKNF